MKNRLHFIAPFAVILLLLIIGSIFDINVSETLYLKNAYFPLLMTGLALTPFCIILSTFGVISFRAGISYYHKIWQKIVSIILGILFIVYGTYLGGDFFTSSLSTNLNDYLIIPIGLSISIPSCVLGFFIYRYIFHKNLLKNLIFLTIVCVFMFGSVLVIKLLIPRVRYIALLQTSMDNFRPWYNPSVSQETINSIKNIDNEYAKSFPSGHASMSILVWTILTYIPYFFPRLGKRQIVLFYSGFAFYLIISLIRIICGHHYLTDVTMAGLIDLSIFFIANEIYLRKIFVNPLLSYNSN